MKILIDNLVYAKIMHMVDKSPEEISGLGKCKWDKDRDAWIVTTAYLCKQQNTSASTELDPESITKLMYETREVEGYLNFWWHSHVDMNVFWSGTDMEAMAQIGGKGMVVSAVFNKKKEVRGAYWQGADDSGFYPHVFVDNLKVELLTNVETSIRDSWDSEYDSNVVKPTYADRYTGLYGDHYEGALLTGQHFMGNYSNKRRYHGGRANDDKYWEGFSQAEKVKPADFYKDGHICEYNRNKRWCAEKKKFIGYSKWKKGHGLPNNLLDYENERALYIDYYHQIKGLYPETDMDVNNFYMEMNMLTDAEFTDEASFKEMTMQSKLGAYDGL